MTIGEAMSRADSRRKNVIPRGIKLGWLSDIDGKIVDQIINTHDGEIVSRPKYDELTKTDTELLLPAPYDEAYPVWLEARIEHYNSNIEGYNNAMTMFESLYEQYRREYNRTHMPKGGKIRYF